MTAILGATAAHANSDKPVYVSIGATARAPIGYVEFCNEMPKECIASASEPRDVVLTSKAWKDLVRVNKWVNDIDQAGDRHGSLGRGREVVLSR